MRKHLCDNHMLKSQIHHNLKGRYKGVGCEFLLCNQSCVQPTKRHGNKLFIDWSKLLRVFMARLNSIAYHDPRLIMLGWGCEILIHYIFNSFLSWLCHTLDWLDPSWNYIIFKNYIKTMINYNIFIIQLIHFI